MTNLKDQVEDILKNYPETRNNDQKLTLYVWMKFSPSKVANFDNKRYIEVNDILSLPKEDTIGRHRRKFQEIGKYLADEKVQEMRSERESEMRKEMSTTTY
jgi:hypothetical protein